MNAYFSSPFYLSYSTGVKSTGVATGDINHDGHTDIVSAINRWIPSQSYYGLTIGEILIFIGRGDGTFYPAYGIATSDSTLFLGVSLADINHDGKLDIISSYYGRTNGMGIHMGLGDGSFYPPAYYVSFLTSPIEMTNPVVADMNGDGITDVVIANHLWLGTDSGIFTLAYYVTGRYSQNDFSATTAADINNDGAMDLIACRYPQDTIELFLGPFSNGTFQTRHTYFVSTGASSYGIVAGDFDKDGALDIVTSNYGPGTISVFRNIGNGTLDAPIHYSTPSIGRPLPIGLADINADGVLDVVTSGERLSSFQPPVNIAIFFGKGNGSFYEAWHAGYDHPVGSFGPYDLALADFNEDGRVDMVMGDTHTADIPVFFNIFTPHSTTSMPFTTLAMNTTTLFNSSLAITASTATIRSATIAPTSNATLEVSDSETSSMALIIGIISSLVVAGGIYVIYRLHHSSEVNRLEDGRGGEMPMTDMVSYMHSLSTSTRNDALPEAHAGWRGEIYSTGAFDDNRGQGFQEWGDGYAHASSLKAPTVALWDEAHYEV